MLCVLCVTSPSLFGAVPVRDKYKVEMSNKLEYDGRPDALMGLPGPALQNIVRILHSYGSLQDLFMTSRSTRALVAAHAPRIHDYAYGQLLKKWEIQLLSIAGSRAADLTLSFIHPEPAISALIGAHCQDATHL